MPRTCLLCRRPPSHSLKTLGPGVSEICHAAALPESSSYKIIYSGILEAAQNGRIRMILLVGAGGFELPAPCAQGGRAAGGRCYVEMWR
jgi:hypothetical protein